MRNGCMHVRTGTRIILIFCVNFCAVLFQQQMNSSNAVSSKIFPGQCNAIVVQMHNNKSWSKKDGAPKANLMENKIIRP